MHRLIKILAVVSLLTAPAGMLALAAVPPGLERAMTVQEAHTNRLLAIDGVVGTAVGIDTGNRAVIKILTENSGVSGLPRSLDGIPVIPLVTGKILARKGRPGGSIPTVDPTVRFDRPVPIGISTGHPDITAGTLGARVRDETKAYALSNNHVYADENNADTGDTVIQPGSFDGGSSPIDNIGTLDRFIPIEFCDPYPNNCPENIIDAAIAAAAVDNEGNSDVGNSTPVDGYGVPDSSTADASPGLEVKKYGRTTGLTNGTVDAINAIVNVGYDAGVARFVGQIVIKPGQFSAGGDSGSLIVTKAGSNPVGLLFAGSKRVTIANPIDTVLDRFGVTIDGM